MKNIVSVISESRNGWEFRVHSNWKAYTISMPNTETEWGFTKKEVMEKLQEADEKKLEVLSATNRWSIVNNNSEPKQNWKDIDWYSEDEDLDEFLEDIDELKLTKPKRKTITINWEFIKNILTIKNTIIATLLVIVIVNVPYLFMKIKDWVQNITKAEEIIEAHRETTKYKNITDKLLEEELELTKKRVDELTTQKQLRTERDLIIKKKQAEIDTLKKEILKTKQEYNPKIENSKKEVIKIEKLLKVKREKQIQNSQSNVFTWN